MNGNDLLQRGQDWAAWFAIPYVKKPNSDPEFRIYFSKEWYEALHLSVRNFFSEIFNGEAEVNQDWIVAGPARIRPEINISKSDPNLSSQSSLRAGDGGTADTIQLFQDGPYNENGRESHVEDFPEVKVDFQETFLGHTSPITRCRFSASGNNIASASEDGTVRIWTYDSSTPASRNATIYCGAKIMSLDWECKSDRLALLMEALKHGMSMQREFVCDLNTSEAFPRFFLILLAGLALGELRKEIDFLRSLWPVTNPPSSQEHLLHPQLLQKPLRPFLARGYFDDVGV
ncbi:hypothetical protein Pyn_14019 [Prunus yedoensis var. nudiflora]|uniref:ARMC9 CTLH-like domain-containing protein n=1 Tax=Prunus yedoensis var. nudiflora TaxID=2094558 RepID=A0A314YWU5_PRUYE|nr:hypothetical protein Pyn_14019 [Prunus yedoensis var. nudiflora]